MRCCCLAQDLKIFRQVEKQEIRALKCLRFPFSDDESLLMLGIKYSIYTLQWAGWLYGQTVYVTSKSTPGSLIGYVLSHLQIWLTIFAFYWRKNSPGLLSSFRKHMKEVTVFISLPALSDKSQSCFDYFIVKFFFRSFSPRGPYHIQPTQCVCLAITWSITHSQRTCLLLCYSNHFTMWYSFSRWISIFKVIKVSFY